MADTRFSTISFSFRRDFKEGRLDMAGYVRLCKELGMAALDPWSAHLSDVQDRMKQAFTGERPGQSEVVLDVADESFLKEVKQMGDDADLPFGCIALDGPTYIYEPEDWKRPICRQLAKRWIDAVSLLDAKQVRIDPGQWHEPEVPDEVMQIIVEGYRDLVAYGADRGVEVLVENHWGCAAYPHVLVQILEQVDGLGLLFDTNNFARGKQAEGWLTLPKYAKATHVKCLHWTPDGEELTQHVGHAVRLLRDAGYDGVWGIESVPRDEAVSEREGVERTMALVDRWLNK
jgi:sugar phosphate isomerase/epimerase